MRTFTCAEAQGYLSDGLAGDIARPDANVLEAHLAGCDPCRTVAEQFLWQDRVIAELSAQARLDALMARVHEGLQDLDPVAVGEEPAPSRWRAAGWVAAAAAFLLAVVGVILWNPSAPEHRVSRTTVPPPQPKPQLAPEIPPQVLTQPEAPEPAIPDTKVADVPSPPPPPAVPKTVPAPLVKESPPVPPPPPQPAPAQVKPVVRAPDVVLRPRTLEEAIRAGLAYLRPRHAPDAKVEELVLWTYLFNGVPEGDPDFQRLLKSILEKKLEKTYNVALAAMALEELDRVKYQSRIHQCAQFLVDNQCQNGQWSYGNPSIFVEDIPTGGIAKDSGGGPRKTVKEFVEPGERAKPKVLRKVQVRKRREGPASGDNSNSMYAALGLRACHDAGVVLPPQVVENAAKAWREMQTRSETPKGAPPAEGWCYGRHEHRPYGSMTAGGVGSLVIYDYIQNKDWKRDREIERGLEWLARNFSVEHNPGPYEHGRGEENSQHQYFYYMYALERAAILYGTDAIGRHDWYGKGAEALLAVQRPDGAWISKDGGEGVTDTCFALLFLRKATRALIDVPTAPVKK